MSRGISSRSPATGPRPAPCWGDESHLQFATAWRSMASSRPADGQCPCRLRCAGKGHAIGQAWNFTRRQSPIPSGPCRSHASRKSSISWTSPTRAGRTEASLGDNHGRGSGSVVALVDLFQDRETSLLGDPSEQSNSTQMRLTGADFPLSGAVGPLWMAPALQVQIDALTVGRLQSSVRPTVAVGRDCWP